MTFKAFRCVLRHFWDVFNAFLEKEHFSGQARRKRRTARGLLARYSHPEARPQDVNEWIFLRKSPESKSRWACKMFSKSGISSSLCDLHLLKAY